MTERSVNLGVDFDLMDALRASNEKEKSEPVTSLDVARNRKDFYKENKNGTKSLIHQNFAIHMINKHYIITLDDQLHIYQEGVYKSNEQIIKQLMIKELPELKQVQIREVLEYIRLTAPEMEHASPFFIACKNGIYDFNKKELLPFNPSIVTTSKINAIYDENAHCETIDKAFITIADEDFQIVQLFLEITAYMIYKQNFLDKAFLLVGHGGNGKSTLMNMWSSFIGEENVSAISLTGLSERFNVAELHHKLLNAGDDIPLQTIKDASNFKKLATGERIMAERKGQDPFTFRNYSKLIFSANDVPRWFENNNGIFDRIVIVPLNANLRNSPNRDPFLEQKITTEEARSYLFKLAIDNLDKLMKKRKFTIPDVSKQRMEEFKVDNNPILTFIAESVIHQKTTQEVYDEYRDWCESEGFRFPLTKRQFTTELKNNGFEVYVTTDAQSRKRVRKFKGKES